MTYKELYKICHSEAVAYANSEQWSKRTGEEKSFLIQGYLDAMMEARKSEITEKEKEYPKTYEECCKVLNIAVRDLDILDNMLDTTEIIYSKNLDRLLNSFRKLLICRDAYWKIAGEEMGLGKPWEPDYNSLKKKYTTVVVENKVVKLHTLSLNCILIFPTEEMRDAFYENFKELINKCKELL